MRADGPGVGRQRGVVGSILPFSLLLFRFLRNCVCVCVCTQSCDPTDYSPQGSSDRRIFQASLLVSHSQLQGLFLTRGWRPRLLSVLHGQADS